MAALRFCFIAISLFILVKSVPVPEHVQIDELEIPSEQHLNQDLVFRNPTELCENAVDNVSNKCTHHCRNKGYEVGLCFEVKCTCV